MFYNVFVKLRKEKAKYVGYVPVTLFVSLSSFKIAKKILEKFFIKFSASLIN
jgi:hypothetical protein